MPSTLEILEAHKLVWKSDDRTWQQCECGNLVLDRFDGQSETDHRAHVAQVLDQHIVDRVKEAKVEAIKEVAKATNYRPAIKSLIRPFIGKEQS